MNWEKKNPCAEIVMIIKFLLSLQNILVLCVYYSSKGLIYKTFHPKAYSFYFLATTTILCNNQAKDLQIIFVQVLCSFRLPVKYLRRWVLSYNIVLVLFTSLLSHLDDVKSFLSPFLHFLCYVIARIIILKCRSDLIIPLN